MTAGGEPCPHGAVGAFVFAFIWSQPAGKFVLAIASVNLAVFVVTFFRGSHPWRGFYDAPDFSKLPFMAGWAAAAALGAGLAKIIEKHLLVRICLTICIAGLLWIWIDASRTLRLIMPMPYVRHWALSFVVVIAACAYLFARQYGESNETSIHAH